VIPVGRPLSTARLASTSPSVQGHIWRTACRACWSDDDDAFVDLVGRSRRRRGLRTRLGRARCCAHPEVVGPGRRRLPGCRRCPLSRTARGLPVKSRSRADGGNRAQRSDFCLCFRRSNRPDTFYHYLARRHAAALTALSGSIPRGGRAGRHRRRSGLYRRGTEERGAECTVGRVIRARVGGLQPRILSARLQGERPGPPAAYVVAHVGSC